jgi:hypothetical protein
VQAAWVVLIRPKSWERYGLKPSRAPKSRPFENTSDYLIWLFSPFLLLRLHLRDSADDVERPDGRAIDPIQLEADKTICRGEMEQAELVTNARAFVPIYLPGLYLERKALL